MNFQNDIIYQEGPATSLSKRNQFILNTNKTSSSFKNVPMSYSSTNSKGNL